LVSKQRREADRVRRREPGDRQLAGDAAAEDVPAGRVGERVEQVVHGGVLAPIYNHVVVR